MVNTSKRGVTYPVTVGVRLDGDTWRELQTVATFEVKKVGTLVRDILIEEIRVYQRNPAYLKHRKKEAEKKRGDLEQWTKERRPL
ncbi:MAG: hypothetical protein HY459_05010 [Parcubacteria group bacterium]|nr:hypothetical protein [Parcubacteria group bacterium]